MTASNPVLLYHFYNAALSFSAWDGFHKIRLRRMVNESLRRWRQPVTAAFTMPPSTRETQLSESLVTFTDGKVSDVRSSKLTAEMLKDLLTYGR